MLLVGRLKGPARFSSRTQTGWPGGWLSRIARQGWTVRFPSGPGSMWDSSMATSSTHRLAAGDRCLAVDEAAPGIVDDDRRDLLVLGRPPGVDRGRRRPRPAGSRGQSDTSMPHVGATYPSMSVQRTWCFLAPAAGWIDSQANVGRRWRIALPGPVASRWVESSTASRIWRAFSSFR